MWSPDTIGKYLRLFQHQLFSSLSEHVLMNKLRTVVLESAGAFQLEYFTQGQR